MSSSGLPAVKAKEVMNTAIHFIDGMATAAEALNKMREGNATTLIVEKRNDQDAWGIVVSQDIVRGVLIDDRQPEKVHVYEVMTKPIITVPSGMDIRYVARLMNRIGIRRVPVEDCGTLVGIVSEDDLILNSSFF